jgi:excinuclease ABC subunit A
VIDLGPEGGAAGGDLVAAGTPEEVARTPGSHTGHYLRQVLGVSDEARARRARRREPATVAS